MKWTWIQVGAIYLTGTLGLVTRVARAQGINPTDTSLPAVPTAGEPASGVAMLVFLAVTTAVLVAIIKVNEFRSKREDEAIALQIRIDDALLAVPGLINSSVAPTVRIPFWRGSPARIELSGGAPSPHLEQVALRVTAQVSSRFRPDFSIENHMVVAPSSGARAAGAGVPECAELAGAKGEPTWLAAASPLRS